MRPNLSFIFEEKTTEGDLSRKLTGLSSLSMTLEGVVKDAPKNPEPFSELLSDPSHHDPNTVRRSVYPRSPESAAL